MVQQNEMKTLLILLLITCKCYSQQIDLKLPKPTFKQYLPSMGFIFAAGLADGMRDVAMYRMDGRSKWWNGKQSWNLKYKNEDINQGEAYFGSTTFLAFTTDAPHFFNMLNHQATGLAFAFAPNRDKTFGGKVLEVVAYNAIRQLGHSVMYGGIFKSTYK